MRQREDHVEVADGQDFGLPLGEPAVTRRGLALRTMAIAAGVIGDGPSCPHWGHRSRWPPRAAVRQRAMALKSFDMRPVQPAAVGLDETVAAARMISATSTGGRFISWLA